ncbi:hypothetical protein BHM03_00046164, partial [Ensete ventricosum]
LGAVGDRPYNKHCCPRVAPCGRAGTVPAGGALYGLATGVAPMAWASSAPCGLATGRRRPCDLDTGECHPLRVSHGWLPL